MCLFQTSSTKLQKTIIIFQLISALLLFSALLACTPPSAPSDDPVARFTLSSSASDSGFNPSGTIPSEFGAPTGNFPKLSWSNAPEGTKYFILVIQDQDKKNWSHGIFVMENVIHEIPKATGGKGTSAAKPMDGESAGSLGTALEEYYPPSPPTGQTHTYIYKLYAVNLTNAKRTIADIAALRADLMNRFTAGAVNVFLDTDDDHMANGSSDRIADIEIYLNDLGILSASASITGTYTGK